MKKLIILLTVICLLFAGCTKDDESIQSEETQATQEESKSYIIGRANYTENPEWRKIDNGNGSVDYYNGGESAIRVTHTDRFPDLESSVNTEIVEAEQHDVKLDVNEHLKVDGLDARFIEYRIDEDLYMYSLYIGSYSPSSDIEIYNFRLYDEGDSTFSKDDFHNLIDSIEIDD